MAIVAPVLGFTPKSHIHSLTHSLLYRKLPSSRISYSPHSIKVRALEGEIQALCLKGAVEPASPSPEFYSRMFVAYGGWRLIIDLSTLNLSVVIFEVSNGDCPVGPPVGSEERLDGYYRSQGRLPPDSDSSVESEVSEVYGRRESLAVQGSLLRPIHGTAGIYPGYDLGIRFSTSSGCQDVAIPGRLADHGFLSRRGLPGKGHGTPTLSRVGDHCKFGKIKLDSISIDCVSGDQDRVADFQGFADSLEDRKVLLNSRRISVIKGAVCEVLESTARSPRVVDAPSSRWPTLDEGFTVSSQKELGRLGLGSLGRPLPRGSSMVVRRGSS